MTSINKLPKRFESPPPIVVWTIGHSTRSIEEFLSVLGAYDIQAIADVRRFPGSRRLPQFSRDALETTLASADLDYVWLEKLGGRRRSTPESQHLAWRHTAFRAYAAHAWTEEFAEGLDELLTIAGGARTAVMCAEVLWWRCHRRIIADVLTSLGIPVVHIRDSSTAEAHHLSAPARLVGGRLTYEPETRRSS